MNSATMKVDDAKTRYRSSCIQELLEEKRLLAMGTGVKKPTKKAPTTDALLTQFTEMQNKAANMEISNFFSSSV